MKMSLDLNALAVESFATAADGDAMHAMLMAPLPSRESRGECCEGYDVAAATVERICTTTR